MNRIKMKKTVCLCVMVLYIFLNHFTICRALAFSPEEEPPEIIAPAAILIDADTGVVLYEKNADERHYPASITKVMTALLAIEFAKDDLNQRVPFSYEAVFTLPYGSSSIAMDEGETLTMEEALYGLMLASANEVANALAEYIGAEQNNFARLMTRRAKELGAENTQFMNAHGLHDDEHYTTARDMAVIMRKAVQYPLFVTLISTPYYEIPPTERQPEKRPLSNSNKLIQPGNYFYEYCIGGKTGYTDEARHTLVAYGQKDDIRLIAVTLQDEKSGPYSDTRALFDYGFSIYSPQTLLPQGVIEREAAVMQRLDTEEVVIGHVGVKTATDIAGVYPTGVNSDSVELVVELPPKLMAPVYAEAVIGGIKLLYDGVLVGEADLLAVDTVLATEQEQLSEHEASAEGRGIVSTLYVVMGVALAAGTMLIGVGIAVGLMNKKKNRRNAYQKTLRGYRYRNQDQ